MEKALEDIVDILPADWPSMELDVYPGDLSRFASGGLGMAGAVALRPWDDLSKLSDIQKYYGSEPPALDPIRSAPSTSSAGGVVYFEAGINRDNIAGMFSVMCVHEHLKKYAVFVDQAVDTEQDRYLQQMRIMPSFALDHLFGVPAEYCDQIEEQSLSIPELLDAFIENQRQTWNEEGRIYSRKLEGTLGGDGDFAKELLAFGFCVENPFWGVYRIWSRPWLVTK